MPLRTVGILSPGDMGHTVGRVLGEHGLHVIACIQGRSRRTQSLAESANITVVPTYQQLVARVGPHPVNPRACPSQDCCREHHRGAWRD